MNLLPKKMLQILQDSHAPVTNLATLQLSAVDYWKQGAIYSREKQALKLTYDIEVNNVKTFEVYNERKVEPDVLANKRQN